jgi:hypothetical protein
VTCRVCTIPWVWRLFPTHANKVVRSCQRAARLRNLWSSGVIDRYQITVLQLWRYKPTMPGDRMSDDFTISVGQFGRIS